MRALRVLIVTIFILMVASVTWGADATIDALQTDVKATKNKADDNSNKINSLAGGLPALEARVTELENGGVQGPQGEQGPIGPQGIQGEVGPAGATGATGPAGADGAVGPQGIQGEVGPVGATGPAGPQGEQGLVGPVGPKGEMGPVGSQGPAGADGAVGATGPQGPAGTDGAAGPQGEQGLTGPAGPQGEIGPQGIQGEAGPVGATGPSGPQGEQGPPGYSADYTPPSIIVNVSPIVDIPIGQPLIVNLSIFDDKELALFKIFDSQNKLLVEVPIAPLLSTYSGNVELNVNPGLNDYLLLAFDVEGNIGKSTISVDNTFVPSPVTTCIDSSECNPTSECLYVPSLGYSICQSYTGLPCDNGLDCMSGICDSGFCTDTCNINNGPFGSTHPDCPNSTYICTDLGDPVVGLCL